MSSSELFKQFYHKLVITLPMNDVTFTAQLVSHDLLPGDLSGQVKSLATSSDKASHFLDCVIKPAVTISVDKSFNKLLTVMEDSEYCNVKELAKQIRSKLKERPVNTDSIAAVHSITTESYSTICESAKKTKQYTALDIAAYGLRATYQTQSSPAQNDWPNYRVTKYVRLALVEKPGNTYRADHEHHIGMLGLRGGVDKIQEERRQINFDDLSEVFCNSNDRLILIMGGPGIGKTTLAHEICMKWARDGFLSKAFHIVILLLLRSIQQQSTEQVFEELIGKEAFQELKRSLGTKCLIIFEGLDEITLEHQQSDNILTKVINCKMLQCSKVVVTSRPHACQDLMKKANKIIEILGFGNKEITEFVQDSFSLDKTQSGEVFVQQLEEHPQLYSLCHVPISLAMIIDIFKEMKSLPSTLTELYYQFMVMMLVRESRKVKEKCVTVPVTNNVEQILHQTVPDVPKEKLGSIFLLGKLAFHGFFTFVDNNQSSKKVTSRDPKIIFVSNDLIQCGIENTDNYDGHSLLKMETLHNFSGGQVTFNFIHLTVQEFLCAVYMLTLSQEEQYHLLSEHFDDYPNIMILYYGLTKLDFHQFIYSKLSSHNSVTAVRCLYEGQWKTAPHKSLSPFVINISNNTLLKNDFLSLSYVFCHYAVTQLNLPSCHIEDDRAKLLAKWCSKDNKTTKLQVLNLSMNNLTDEGMKHVIEIVASSPLLRELDVKYNYIGDPMFSCFEDYTYQQYGLSAVSDIKIMLTKNSALQYLNISGNQIGDDGTRMITEGIICNNTLIWLSAEGCAVSVKGATYIKEMLMKNKKLQKLYIAFNSFGDDGVRHVTEGMQKNDTLTDLKLDNCDISVKGSAYIKELVKKNKKLQYLNIAFNYVGNDGMDLITEGLLYNNTLTKLSVTNCYFSVEGARYIKLLLMKNKKIECLKVGCNAIGDDGVRHITQGLQQNDTLTELRLQYCEMSVEGAICIKEMLVRNQSLKRLDISDNKIGDDGVKHITEGLQQNRSLTNLDLADCKVSVKGAISISEMIKINHTLQVLDIRVNPIGDEGIAAIVTDLNEAMISELFVFNCKITVTGAKALAEGLVNNHSIKLLDVWQNDITVNGAIAILEAAVANKVCEEVMIDNEYQSDDKVKEMMSILEERKRQEESKIESKDVHVTMPTEDHHGNTSVKDDQPQEDTISINKPNLSDNEDVINQ